MKTKQGPMAGIFSFFIVLLSAVVAINLLGTNQGAYISDTNFILLIVVGFFSEALGHFCGIKRNRNKLLIIISFIFMLLSAIGVFIWFDTKSIPVFDICLIIQFLSMSLVGYYFGVNFDDVSKLGTEILNTTKRHIHFINWIPLTAFLLIVLFMTIALIYFLFDTIMMKNGIHITLEQIKPLLPFVNVICWFQCAMYLISSIVKIREEYKKLKYRELKLKLDNGLDFTSVRFAYFLYCIEKINIIVILAGLPFLIDNVLKMMGPISNHATDSVAVYTMWLCVVVAFYVNKYSRKVVTRKNIAFLVTVIISVGGILKLGTESKSGNGTNSPNIAFLSHQDHTLYNTDSFINDQLKLRNLKK